MTEPLLSFLGIKAGNAVAAIMGSAVSLAMFRRTSTFNAILAFFVGATIAIYMGPAVAHHLNFTEDHSFAAVNFITGVFGMAAFAGIANWFELFRKSPTEAIEKLKNLGK